MNSITQNIFTNRNINHSDFLSRQQISHRSILDIKSLVPEVLSAAFCDITKGRHAVVAHLPKALAFLSSAEVTDGPEAL